MVVIQGSSVENPKMICFWYWGWLVKEPYIGFLKKPLTYNMVESW